MSITLTLTFECEICGAKDTLVRHGRYLSELAQSPVSYPDAWDDPDQILKCGACLAVEEEDEDLE